MDINKHVLWLIIIFSSNSIKAQISTAGPGAAVVIAKNGSHAEVNNNIGNTYITNNWFYSIGNIRNSNVKDSSLKFATRLLEKDTPHAAKKADSILKPSYDKLLKQYNDVIEKQLNLKHDIAEIAYQRAYALNKQYKFIDANTLLRKAVEFDSSNLNFQVKFAASYLALGNPRAAFQVMQNAKPHVANAETSDKNSYYFGLAWLYQLFGKVDSAIYYLQFGIIDTMNTDEKDSTVAEYYSDIAYKWYLKEDYDKTLDCLLHALAIDTSLNKDQNKFKIGDLYNQIARTYYAMGQSDSTISYLLRALTIYSSKRQKINIDIADIYWGLAEAWNLKGNPDKAIEYYSQAIEIYSMVFNSKHPILAEIYSSLGHIWFLKDKAETAIDYYSRAVEIDTNTYGKNHITVVQDFTGLGLAYNLKGNHDKAIVSFEQGLQAGLSIWDSENPEIIKLQGNIKTSKQKENRNRDAAMHLGDKKLP